MNNSRCFKNGHIPNYVFLMLENQILDDKEREEIAEHLAKCDNCADNYADFLMGDEEISVPMNLEENIITAVIAANNIKRKRASLVPQFLKMGFAALITISLYSAGVFSTFTNATYDVVNSANVMGQRELINTKEIYKRFDKELIEFSNTINNGFMLRDKK